MAWASLGKITVATPGVPINITANVTTSAFGVSTTYYACQAILFQAAVSNLGKSYVGNSSNFAKASGVGLLAALGVPTANIIPSASVTIPNAPAGLNAAEYWVDVDNGGEGVIVSVLVP